MAGGLAAEAIRMWGRWARWCIGGGGTGGGAMAVAVPEVGARVAEVWAAEARAVVEAEGWNWWRRRWWRRRRRRRRGRW